MKEQLGKCLVIYKSRYWTDKEFELHYEFFENAIAIEEWINKKFVGKDIEHFPESPNFHIVFMGYVASQYTPILKEKVKKITIEV